MPVLHQYARSASSFCLQLILVALCVGYSIKNANAEPGKVEIPLARYEELLGSAGSGSGRHQSAGFAIGSAQVQARAELGEGRATVFVHSTMKAQVFEEGWTRVSLLSAGTALSSATVNGAAVALVADESGIAWMASGAGSYSIEVRYQVDASSSGGGYSVNVPVPRTASTSFSATIPREVEVSVLPSTGAKLSTTANASSVSATIPATTGVQLSWQSEDQGGHTLSRAVYEGRVVGDAIEWTATLTAELFGNDPTTIKILPASVALKDVTVDGKTASILRRDDSFATLAKGLGRHKIIAVFLVPIVHDEGPPSALLEIRKIPISQFSLVLPGKKAVQTEPAAEVQTAVERTRTLAQVYLPMTESVRFTWSEAIPEEEAASLRANAIVYSSALAEEGVLHATAMVEYQVSRGETHLIEFDVPADVQINEVRGASEGVSEWRVADATNESKSRTLRVFLNRPLTSTFRLAIDYERLLDGTDGTFEVPLLAVQNTHRQRGMIALLTGRSLTMQPVGDSDASRVGENQLPKFVRETLQKRVAHTYKYVGKTPSVNVKTAAPERQQGRFDAQVDTMVSLGDATMKAVALIEIDVKSGGIVELDLELPAHVNFLKLNAPSLRGSSVIPSENGKTIVHAEFTQDMEGQFLVEVSYERIMKEGDSDLDIATVQVQGTEVEQGRIAVEALSAMEVVAMTAKQLTPVELSQLPHGLVGLSTNPILMAYRYAHAEATHNYTLALKLTRHRAIATQAAVIDHAQYTSLFTREGLMITRAKFSIRNASEQFLKLRLPPGSTVWKAFVAGHAEKPALVKDSEKSDKGPEVLINIINSTDAFTVEVVYKTPAESLGGFGTISGKLARPDMIATKTTWDVYLPEGMTYRHLESNLNLIAGGGSGSVNELLRDDSETGKLLRIAVPASGVHYRLEKVYANQSSQVSQFSLSFMSPTGILIEQFLATIGMLFLLLGAAYLWTGRHRVVWIGRKRKIRIAAIAGVLVGLLFLTGTVGIFGASASNPLKAAFVLGIASVVRFTWLQRRSIMQFLRTLIPKRRLLPATVGGVAGAVAITDSELHDSSPQEPGSAPEPS